MEASVLALEGVKHPTTRNGFSFAGFVFGGFGSPDWRHCLMTLLDP